MHLGQGVSPDVEFPHDLAADRDLLLERAVQLLLQRLRSYVGSGSLNQGDHDS